MFMRLGIRLGVFCTVAVGVTVWHYTDRALNFVQVEGRIDSLRTTCSVKGARGSLAYIDDCDQLAAKAADGDFSADKIVRNARVRVRYASPADGQIHSASFHTSGAGAAALTEGGVVTIYASKTSPEKIELR